MGQAGFEDRQEGLLPCKAAPDETMCQLIRCRDEKCVFELAMRVLNGEMTEEVALELVKKAKPTKTA